jgi:hypothetical protein
MAAAAGGTNLSIERLGIRSSPIYVLVVRRSRLTEPRYYPEIPPKESSIYFFDARISMGQSTLTCAFDLH